MSNYTLFEDWSGGATESEIAQMEADLKKRTKKWMLLSLIPLLNIFITGIAIFSYNTYSYVKTRGDNTGSNIIRLVFLLWGLFGIFALGALYISYSRSVATQPY